MGFLCDNVIIILEVGSNMKKHLKGFIHGILIGVAFISAMGGGTLAVILGIYDDLVSAITNLRKDFKKSVAYLAPILLGAIIGIVSLAYPIKLFLEWQPFIATSLFVGLTIGGLVVFKKLTNGHVNVVNTFFLFVGLLLVAVIGVISWFTYVPSDSSVITFNGGEMLILFLIGFFASSALIAPGISGTMFLISLGYYNKLLELIKTVLSFSGSSWGINVLLLFSFAVGFIIGFFAITKLMDILLKHFRIATYFAILGLILGQIIISYFNGEIRQAYANISSIPLEIVFSTISLIVGVTTSYFLLKFAEKKEIVQVIGDKNDEA